MNEINENQIKRRLEAISKFKVDPEVTTRDIERVRQTLTDQNRHQTEHQNIWKLIIKSRITKLAVAAIVIIAIMIGIKHFGGSIDGASVLYAQVRESIEKKSWICAKVTVLKGEKAFGGEEWFSLESKIIVEIIDDGKIKYWDFNHNRRYEYQPMSDTITISPIKEPPSFIEAKTVLGLFEKLIERKKGAVLSRTLVEQDSKTLEIWGVARSEDTGSEKIKLFIDTNEYLPITAEVTYTDTTGKTIYQGTIEFEYPENGPKNIYELGVPKDAKVVHFEGPSLELVDIATEYDKRRSQLGDFRALTIYGNKINPQFTIFEYLASKNQRRHSISREIADYNSKSLDELVETLFSGGWLPLLDATSEVFPEGHLPNNIILLEPKMVDLFSNYCVGQWKSLTSDEPELLNKLGFELKAYPKNGVFIRTWWFDPENDYWVSRFTSEMLEDNATLKTQFQVTAFNKTIGGHSYPSQIIHQMADSNQVVQAHYDIYMEEAVHSSDVDRAFIGRALKTLIQRE